MYRLDAPLIDSPPLYRVGLPEYKQHNQPSAGADFSFSIPGEHFIRLVSVSVRLVTDANVASREVVISYETAEGNRFGLSGINTTVAASLTADYVFSVFQPEAVATVDSSALVPLQQVILLPSQVLKIHVVSVQVGDQLSRIRTVWERFFTTAQPDQSTPFPGPEYL